MEILFVIVQLIYNFRSILTLTPLWISSFNGNSIGDTSSSLQLSQHFHINTIVWFIIEWNSIGDSSTSLQLLQNFHIYHIVEFIIEWKIALEILQILYSFRNFHISHMLGFSIELNKKNGDSSNFLWLLKYFNIYRNVINSLC